jgi:hypothetical protein
LAATTGCTRPAAKSSAISAESHAPGTTAAIIAAPCKAYPKDAPGVVGAYCDGRAVVKLTVGDKPYTLQGGTCAVQNGVFSLNVGVLGNKDLAGPKPDYIGLTTSAAPGPFTNATLKVIIDGKTYRVRANTGETSSAGGHFDGVSAAKHVKVTGVFSC